MKKEGFEQEFIRGIKKLIPLPIMKAKKRKKNRKRLAIAVMVLLVIGAISVPYINKMMKYQEAVELYAGKKYVEAAKIFEEIADFKDANDMREEAEFLNAKTQEYEIAKQLYYDGNYPEAAWAFSKLDSFEDSREMKEKAEKSWRLSNVNIAMINWDGAGWGTQGSYYVSANGTINSFKFDPGNAYEGIGISEHGKIVSLGGNAYMGNGEELLKNNFWALHEDGYVENVNYSEENSDEWNDIIQISPGFNSTHVALRADGTMVHGKLKKSEREENVMLSDSWLSKVTKWKDVVAFDSCSSRLEGGMVIQAAVIALKVDGTLYSVFGREKSFEEKFEREAKLKIQKVKSFINTIENAKDVSSCYNGFDYQIAVLKTNGEVIRYSNGKTKTYQEEDVVCVQESVLYDAYGEIKEETYILTANGDLMMLGSDKVILSDVVYIDERFAVTRSGSIYRYNHVYYNKEKNEPFKTEGKARVYDEWLGRMK